MKTRVLVIDDDRLVADTLCLIYKANGYESEARYSASEGFECAITFQPAIVLCDVVLPEESGMELARRVQDALPGARMLMLTAYIGSALHAETQSRKLKRPPKFLTKPCRPDDLLRETQALLRRA